MNKTMKSGIALLTASLLLLAGCQSSTASAGKATSAAVSSASADSVSVTLTGTLAGYSGEVLSVLANGKTYSFHITDRSVFSTPDVLNMGDTVDVTYSGQVNGTDCLSASVSKVLDKTPESQTIQTTVGVALEETGTTITIQTAYAKLTFNTANATKRAAALFIWIAYSAGDAEGPAFA